MPAAGFTLQDEATTFGVAFEGANERMETMELVFAGSEVDAHISGEQDDLGVGVSFRWVTGFPDMAAAKAALAGATDLVAGDAAPMECLPTGAVLPQGVDDAVFDDGLAEQPFTLTGYTVALEEGGQQAARGLFSARTEGFDLQELEVIISANLWDPDETQVRVHWE